MFGENGWQKEAFVVLGNGGEEKGGRCGRGRSRSRKRKRTRRDLGKGGGEGDHWKSHFALNIFMLWRKTAPFWGQHDE
jgi:hypothetical protein